MATEMRLSPYLIVVQGGIPGALLPLAAGANTLGRAAENTVQLIERTISRRHAVLDIDPPAHPMLTDLNSSNGTYLNGARVPQGTPVELQEGDHVRFGTAIVVRFAMLAPNEEQTHRLRFDRSVRDELTNLYKMEYFLDRVACLADRYSRDDDGLAIALIDVDLFRELNERHGKDAGDEALREVSELMSDFIKPEDLIARIAADTFIVAMAAPDLESAKRWAEQLRHGVSRRLFHAGGRLCRLTVSMGLGYNPPHSQSPALAISNAEICLGRAKIGGRNCVVAEPLEILWS